LSVLDPPLSIFTCAVGTAEDPSESLHAMTHDPATAVFTKRSQRMDGAFETIEDVSSIVHRDPEGLVIVVSANLASAHLRTSLPVRDTDTD
jgi:hypothetical protein